MNFPPQHRSPLSVAVRYGLAVGAVAAGLGLRAAVTAWVGPGLPTYVTFYPAVMVAALLAGLGPGLLATALAGWVVAHWVLPPAGLAIASPVDRVGLVLFTGMGLFMSGLAEIYRRQRGKAAAYDQELVLRDTRREKEFLANLLEHASQAFAVGYPDGRLGRHNQAFNELTGYSTAELRGLDWSAVLTPPEWRELERQRLEELRRTGLPVRYEKEYLRKDGSRVPIELLVHLARDAQGRPEYYYAFITDITEREQAETQFHRLNVELGQRVAELEGSRGAALNLIEDAVQARDEAEQAAGKLRESEQRMRRSAALLNESERIAHIGGWEWDVLSGELAWSDQMFRIFGEDRASFVPSYEGFLAHLHPDDRELTDGITRNALAQGCGFAAEYRILTRPGEIRVVQAQAEAILDPAGRLVRMVGTVLDITERKQAEEAANRSHRTFVELIECSPFGIYVVDSKFRVAQMNAASQTGLFQNVRPVVGRDLTEAIRILWHEPVAADLIGHFRHTLATGEPYCSREFFYPRQDTGILEAYEWELHRMTLPDGQYGVVCYYYDSTRLREVEAALRAKEADLRQINQTLAALAKSNEILTRASEESTYLQDVCKIVVEKCGHAMVWIGYAEDDEARSVRPVAYSGFEEGYLETLQLTWADTERGRGPTGAAIRTGRACACRNMLVDPQFAPWREQALRRGYASSLALPLRNADMAFGALTIYSQEPDSFAEHEVALLAELADNLAYGITALRVRAAHARAEAALHESEARFRSLVEQTVDGIFVSDAQGHYLDVNSAGTQMLGYSREEVLQLHISDVIAAEEAPRLPVEVARFAGGQVVRSEWRFRRKDGSCFPGEVMGRQLPDGRLQAILRDISERKQAEEFLKSSLREKEVLLKEIHHRVKNNLQVISSLVSLQSDYLEDPALRGIFADVRDRVRSMSMVHEKLYQSENLAQVDFAAYAEGLLTYHSRAYASAGVAIRITLDLQPVLLPVQAAVPCGLILNELATNAYKYAFRGRSDGEITVNLRAEPDGRICLRVRDNGVGLPPGLDWRQSRSLGLRLVQMLAGQLHGTVEMRSGAGTECVLNFGPLST